MRKLRVLHVINSMNAGGAEHLLLSQIKAGGHLWDSAIAVVDESGALVHQVNQLNIPFFSAPETNRFDLRSLGRLAASARQWRPDVVHLHLPRSGILGRLAFRFGGRRPIIYTEHNLLEMYSAPIRALNVATYAGNDATIAVSQGVRVSIEHYVPRFLLRRQPIVVHNGVDVPRLEREALSRSEARGALGVEADSTVIGTVGNLFERKGHRYLIESLSQLGDLHENVRGVIIGSGDDRDRLASLAAQMGVSERLSIVSGIGDANRYLCAFDVFVLPSIFEGLPMALLEAMALGIPTIASRVGGIPEVIDHDVTGWLVPARDARALAAQIRIAIGNEALSRNVGSRGKRRVEDAFSIQRLVNRTESIYRELLPLVGTSADESASR